MLGLEREVALHRSAIGSSQNVDRSVRRGNRFNVAGVAGERIFAFRAEVAIVLNLAAVRFRLHERAADAVHDNVAAHRGDFQMAVVNVVNRDGAVEGPGMDVTVSAIKHFDSSIRAFQRYVAVQLLGVNDAASGMQCQVRIRGHLHLVLHDAAVLIGPGQKMRSQIYAAAALTLVHFDFVGVKDCSNHHFMGSAGFYGDGAVLIVDGDHRVLADFEMQVLASGCSESHTRQGQHRRGSSHAFAANNTLCKHGSSPHLLLAARAVHRQLVQHLFLRVRIHQQLLRIDVAWITLHLDLGIV